MRIANLAGRLVLVRDDRAVDVAAVSAGRFSADPAAAYPRWDELRAWADTLPDDAPTVALERGRLGPASPAPRQIIAAGLNYRDHAAEAGSGVADDGSLPPIFAKFPPSLVGPDVVVALPEGDVDWEVELAVVVGRTARNVAEEDAWGHVAGVTVSQDLSERRLQFAGPSPQFGLAKSYPGFLPLGPWVVTPDELDDPDAVPLSATLNGEVVQDGSTSHLVCAVAPLIARLSRIVPLHPGDVLLTGTPGGGRDGPDAAPVPRARRRPGEHGRGGRVHAPAVRGRDRRRP